VVFRLHQMHEMQTIVTDVRGVCLSVCPSHDGVIRGRLCLDIQIENEETHSNYLRHITSFTIITRSCTILWSPILTSVRLSRGFIQQTWLNGLRSCWEWKFFGNSDSRNTYYNESWSSSGEMWRRECDAAITLATCYPCNPRVGRCTTVSK